MIRKIIAFSVQNKLAISFMMLFWIGMGIFAMREIPIDATPDITNNQIQVITTAPSLGTEDIERFITYPVELSMANLPGVIELRSVSRSGLSVVTVVFKDESGTYLPRQLVAEKLEEVKEDIPESFGSPMMGPISTGLSEIYQYCLEVEEGYTYSPTELRSMQDWIVKRQMAMLEGVAEVNSFGGNLKQYEVALHPQLLHNYELSVVDVFEALESSNANTGGAYIEKNHQANFIRGEGLLTSISDIENIVVKVIGGAPILVKDIAKVQFGRAIRYGAFTKDGKDAVGGLVMMLKGANSDKVIKNVIERVAQIEKSLPEGVHIKPFLDRTKLIERTTSTVATNLIEGGLIVIFVLVLLLGNWRGGLIVASTIPLSLLFAFIMMYIFDVWANLMSLGAIDFGIIVDGAVIIVESIVLSMQKFLKSKSEDEETSKDKLVVDSSSKMMNAAFFGQLIILIVFVPILSLTGVEGKMFKPMALTFSFAIIGAMILCLTYVPMVSSVFMSWKGMDKFSFGDKVIQKLEDFYAPIVQAALKYRRPIVFTALLSFVLSLWQLNRMGGEFMPQLDEGDIAMHAILKPGSALSETENVTKRIEQILLAEFPDELESVASKIGVSEIPTDPMPLDLADVFLILKPDSEWKKVESKAELIEKVEEALSVLPGVNLQFSQPIEMRFNELMTGVREDIAIKIYGEELDVLAQKAKEVSRLVANVEGVGDMNVEATQGLPQMNIRYDRKRLARYGLHLGEINDIIQSAFSGKTAGQIFEGERRFDLVLRFEKDFRSDLESLRNLYVPTPTGGQIRLSEVAKIEYQEAPMQITREDTHRRISIGINVRGRDVESLIQEIEGVLDEKLNLPAGYYIRYGGAFENLQQAKERLFLLVPVALLLIFILLFFALKSIRQTTMIFIAIPLATMGGVWAMLLRGMPFSISAGIGFIVLFGVAVLNGLVLISSLNALKEEGVTDIKQRILLATKERLRPILLTASTDILGFLPMALSRSAGAEVQRPLATVVIGGLFTATVLTLIIIPILYYVVEKREERKDEEGSALGLITPQVVLPTILFTLFFFQSQFTFAQESEKVWRLEDVLSTAVAYYPTVQQADLSHQAASALKSTAVNINKTQVFIGEDEAGGEDFGIRTVFGVSQQFAFPTVYSAQHQWLNELEELQGKNVIRKENELNRLVKKAWYKQAVAQKKFELFRRIDSVYVDFEQSVELRYNLEETSRTEYLNAMNTRQLVQVFYQQMLTELRLAQFDLQRYVGSAEVIKQSLFDLEAFPMIDLANLDLLQNPDLQYFKQMEEVSDRAVKIEKNKFLPDIQLQYRWQERDDPGMISRLYSYQVGLAIPLWFVPQKGKLQAAKLNKQLTEQKYKEEDIRLQTLLQQKVQEYRQLQQTLFYYQEQALPLSEEQIKHAKLSYEAGEIDYVTYIRSLDNAMKTQSMYWDTVHQFYQVFSDIEYYLGGV
ncbi:CusA/CzcA family heavy metal efflux RND transporter [Sediminitomix flava]|uniref:Cobalt-zinc-cadmium resistance protein CzcA n=1 Tax=Sediminitomix flava TaxID=379075 RepID=A0A315ZCL3_SEDFL|nr:CusA/CzcA family heavy metal efflux RND transporter [Sediminitomix flava]PWJ43325.1 cobalt-zinc-cadmium resistance protein CzcA [Sediminitomix flava]